MAEIVNWVNSIYENENIVELMRKLNKYTNANDLMDKILDELNSSPTNEELIALAELELFLTGKVFYTSDVLNLLNNIIEDFESNFYHNYFHIKPYVLQLKQSILDSRNEVPVCRTNEEISNWFKEKEKLELPF